MTALKTLHLSTSVRQRQQKVLAGDLVQAPSWRNSSLSLPSCQMKIMFALPSGHHTVLPENAFQLESLPPKAPCVPAHSRSGLALWGKCRESKGWGGHSSGPSSLLPASF